jgi:hypothetical protein
MPSVTQYEKVSVALFQKFCISFLLSFQIKYKYEYFVKHGTE